MAEWSKLIAMFAQRAMGGYKVNRGLLLGPVTLASGTGTMQVSPWLPGFCRLRMEGVRQQR